MGFFSQLAKHLIGKSDDEAQRIIGSNLPIGSDLPQQDGITGTLPRPTRILQQRRGQEPQPLPLPPPKPYDFLRKMDASNPAPGAIFDPLTSNFQGYEPQSPPIRVEPSRVASAKVPPPRVPPDTWRAQRPKAFFDRLVQDVRDTVSDIRDEPGEVPHRVGERLRDYLPAGSSSPDKPQFAHAPSRVLPQPNFQQPRSETPPPQRQINVDVGEPPPASEPAFITAMEKVNREMPRPHIGPNTRLTPELGIDYYNRTGHRRPDDEAPASVMTGMEYRNQNPTLPPPQRTTVEGPTSAIEPSATGTPMPPPQRVMVGESYKGMSPTEKAAAHVRALEQAGQSSKVSDTGTGYEIEPPHKLSRLKAMGKGFLMRMISGAQYGPGGMLGAGTVGAIEGVADPGHIEKQLRKTEIAKAQGDQYAAGQLESQTQSNTAQKLSNLARAADIANEPQDRARVEDQRRQQEYAQGLNVIGDLQKQQSELDPASQEYSAAQAAIEQEATRLSERTGRKVSVIPGNRKLNQLPKLAIDGQIVQQQYDGSWKAVYGEPKAGATADYTDDNKDQESDYAWQVKNQENAAKRSQAQEAMAAAESAAADHQRKVASAAAAISTLDQQMGQMSTRHPALGPLKRQRAQLEQTQRSEEAAMNSAYRERDKAKADAAGVPTIPRPPKRVRRAATSRMLPRTNLPEAARRLIQQGAISNAAQAESYLRSQGVTIQ